MLISPISENKASEELKNCYLSLKRALNSQTLPIFFTYIGAFPEYLSYITDQLVQNLEDPSFTSLINQLNNEVVTEIHARLQKSKETVEWISLYKNSPSFYNFQKDLEGISLTNAKLACIFVTLREAVKGWAVAAKKLSESTVKREAEREGSITEDDFIFDRSVIESYRAIEDKQDRLSAIKENYLARRSEGAIEKDILPDYLRISSSDFRQQMKYDYFWTLRVSLEEKVLSVLAMMPHLVFSPYNVIVGLTQKYENFYELLYLLSEQFPTLAMQRLMFSGYMMV
jgi:hypothetical protein